MQTVRSLFARPLAGEHASRVVRPRFPPVLTCALAWFASSAASYPLLEDISRESCTILCVACLLVMLVCLFAMLRCCRAGVLFFALGAILGVASASSAAVHLHVQEEALLAAKGGEYELIVKEDAQRGKFGSYCVCEEEGSGARIRLYVPEQYENLRYGDVLIANVDFSAPSKASASTYWRLGQACSAKASSVTLVERVRLITPLLLLRNKTLDSLLEHDANSDEGTYSDAGMIARALMCGYRSGLSDSSIYLDFQAAGLAHMIAVSGAHLTLVCGVIAAFLTRLKVRRSILVATELVTIGCYLVVAAAPVSALRAAVMACTALMSFFVKRRKASLNALGLSMLALMVAHPQNCVSISFTLSVVATLGIIVFFPLVSDWLADWLKPVHASIRDTLSLTLTANLCTIPISAAMFSKVSLIAPVSNCICAPILLVTCTVGCVVLIVSCLFPPLSWVGIVVVHACSHVFCCVVNALASIPYACVAASVSMTSAVAISAVACFVLWLYWPRISVRAACVALTAVGAFAAVWIFVSALLTGTRIVMLDVGQGDAFLVQSDGKTALIDTGNEPNRLLAGLAQYNVRHIDCVIISHSDDDHCGCLRELCSSVRVDAIILDEWVPQCSCNKCANLLRTSRDLLDDERVKTMGVGDTLHVGDVSLEAIWPDSFVDEGGNADSLCLLASADIDEDGSTDFTALFCGDAESDQLMRMVAKGRVPHIDILKVGHHGSKDAVGERLLNELQPSIALISVGAYNEYGHPAAQTLKSLEESGARVFRSDESGSVTCKLESSKLIVSSLG